MSGDESLGWRCGECRDEGLTGLRGCDGPAVSGLAFEHEGHPSRCPHAVLKEHEPGDEVWRYVEIWRGWRATGVLPYAGDLGDQPAQLAEAVELIDIEERRARGEEQIETMARLRDMAQARRER